MISLKLPGYMRYIHKDQLKERTNLDKIKPCTEMSLYAITCMLQTLFRTVIFLDTHV